MVKQTSKFLINLHKFGKLHIHSRCENDVQAFNSPAVSFHGLIMIFSSSKNHLSFGVTIIFLPVVGRRK